MKGFHLFVFLICAISLVSCLDLQDPEQFFETCYAAVKSHPHSKEAFEKYSGHNLGSLGDTDSCNAVPSMRYVVFSSSPPNYAIGLCLAKKMKRPELRELKDQLKEVSMEAEFMEFDCPLSGSYWDNIPLEGKLTVIAFSMMILLSLMRVNEYFDWKRSWQEFTSNRRKSSDNQGKKTDESTIDFFRFVCLLVHSLGTSLELIPTTTSFGLEQATEDATTLPMLLFSNSYCLHEIFFVSTGVLYGRNLLHKKAKSQGKPRQETHKKGSVPILVKRIFRHLPGITFVSLFLVFVLPAFAHNALGYHQKKSVKSCEKTLPLTLLFVNNLFINWIEPCLPQTWVVNVCIQLIIIVGILGDSLPLAGASVLLQYYWAYDGNYGMRFDDRSSLQEYSHMTPFTHIPSFLIGIWLARYYSKEQKSGVKVSRRHLTGSLIAGIVLIIYALFGIHPALAAPDLWTKHLTAFYSATMIPAIATGFCLIFYYFFHFQADHPVMIFMGADIFARVNKLGAMFAITKWSFLSFYYYNINEPIHASIGTALYASLATIPVCLFASFILFMFIETPVKFFLEDSEPTPAPQVTHAKQEQLFRSQDGEAGSNFTLREHPLSQSNR